MTEVTYFVVLVTVVVVPVTEFVTLPAVIVFRLPLNKFRACCSSSEHPRRLPPNALRAVHAVLVNVA